jgi:hypothetical protein
MNVQMETFVDTISALSSVTLRLSQTVYELMAVDKQACELLDRTTQIDSCMGAVRPLRRQKSALLSSTLKKWIDHVISDTDKTLQNVAALIEPARVDMRTKSGKVSFKNKVTFVLRDSPLVGTNLYRLAMVSQSLNTALGILSSMDEGDLRPMGNLVINANADPRCPPPAYGEIMRLRRERGRYSRSSITTGSQLQIGDVSAICDEKETVIATDQLASVPTLVSTVQQEPPIFSYTPDDGLIFVEARGELSSSPIDFPNPHRNNSTMDGADAPQVAMSDLPELVEDFDGMNLDPNTSRPPSAMPSLDWQFPHLPPRFPQSRPCSSASSSHNIPAQRLQGRPLPYKRFYENPPYPGSTISPNSTANHLKSHTSSPPSEPERNASPTASLTSIVSDRSTHALTPQSPPQVIQGPQWSTQMHPQTHTRSRYDTPLESNASRRGLLRGKERREAWLEFQTNR